MTYKGTLGEYLYISKLTMPSQDMFNKPISDLLTIIWFLEDGNDILIDHEPLKVNKDSILCLTEFHSIKVNNIKSCNLVQFNRPFYCITDHDSEVGCKGILFFGASQVPLFKIPVEEKGIFETVYKMFELELKNNDTFQLEMLQMMLKRFLILCTRAYKSEYNYHTLNEDHLNIVRNYNFVVEQHFKSNHSVADYASMLHKSPKTLSNLFTKISKKTPLQFIQDRIMLEARKKLLNTDEQVSEIAHDLGFNGIQAFSRFFKKKSCLSPKEFRSHIRSGKID